MFLPHRLTHTQNLLVVSIYCRKSTRQFVISHIYCCYIEIVKENAGELYVPVGHDLSIFWIENAQKYSCECPNFSFWKSQDFELKSMRKKCEIWKNHKKNVWRPARNWYVIDREALCRESLTCSTKPLPLLKIRE